MNNSVILDNQKLDPECFALCKAMNSLFGITTTESCCGHGKDPFCIWFTIDGLTALPDLLYFLDPCHIGYTGWECCVTTDCGKSPVRFHIKGPIGAYKEADDIAERIVASPKRRKEARACARIELLQGVAGRCLLINDIRVCGPKALGGGRVIEKWQTKTARIEEALLEPAL